MDSGTGPDKDPFHLQRFVDAQNPVYESVLVELSAGRKVGHWMWFIFPQIAGLGHSGMSRRFAISGRAEAQAYLHHPVLGPRLRECARLVTEVEGRSIDEILGYPDDRKFRSSMTLFLEAAPGDPVFHAALQKYFDGQLDQFTVQRLNE